MSNTSFDAPALDPWSEVRARDRVTRYRRSGAGQAVLLLDTAAQSSLWPELLHVLGANFRLIVPEVPAENNVAWLSEFLEGLGCMPVALVAASDFVVPALELALRDLDQVGRLVLVPDGEADEAWSDGVLTTSAGPASTPVLVVRRGLDAATALPTISRFLSSRVAG